MPANQSTPEVTRVELIAWRCFHCGDVFTDESCARLHFGRDEDSQPACIIKAGAEQGLLGALRAAEYEAADARRAIADECTDAARAHYAQATRHDQALRNAEELGYERGLADGRALPPARGGDKLREAVKLTIEDASYHLRKYRPHCLEALEAALASTDMAGAGEWALIQRLRDEEADSVTILCDNPDGPPNAAVECCGLWTGFAERRFEGDTIVAALGTAVAAKDEAARVGYPELAAPPVEGLTSGEGEVLREYAAAAYAVMPGGPSVTDDMWRRYGRAADAYQAMLAAAPKATATASVRGFDLDDGEWFYPEGDHSSDECRHSADEVIDYALEGGAKSQVVCIERATSLPAVYAAVRVFTDAEKDERNSDDDYAYTLFATAEDARASLTDSGTAATIGGERA